MTPALLVFLALPLGLAPIEGPDTIRVGGLTAEQFAARLKYQRGVILLRGGLATVNLPRSFRYLDPEQAELLLVQAWGSPPGNETLGMLFPAGLSPLSPEGWGVVISYEEEGHIKDAAAEGLDYDALLKDMRGEHQSPKLIPRSRAVAMVSESSGTRLGLAMASAMGTAVIVGGCRATIMPKRRSATKRTAAAPKRRPRSRSKVVGLPPRCRWPSTSERVSLPVI